MKWRLYKEKLLWLRLNQGWSQEEAAHRCGAPDKKTYHLWETGKIARPQIRNLKKIIHGFHLERTDDIVLKPAEIPATELDALYRVHFSAARSVPVSATTKPASGFKLVCFDMDATLIQGLEFSTRAIWDALGDEENLRKQGIRSYYTGRFTYEEWCLWITDIFRQKGLTLERFRQIIEHYYPAPHLQEGLAQLKQRGYRLALVSNGLGRFLDELAPGAIDYFDDVYVNRLLFDDSGHLQSVTPSPYSLEKKVDAIRHICQEQSIPMEAVVFVGSSFLNRQVAFQVGLTIGYARPSREISDIFDVIAKGDDFLEVVKLIAQHDSSRR